MEGQEDRRARMMGLVQQWRESGKSARVFAREQGVTPWTLYYWREVASHDRAARRRRRSPTRRGSLVPVRVINGSHPDGELEVILATGDRVRVPASVSLERFHRVLQVVKAC